MPQYDLSVDVGMGLDLEVRQIPVSWRWQAAFKNRRSPPILSVEHDFLEAAIYDLAGQVLPMADKVEAVKEEGYRNFKRFSISLLPEIYFDVSRQNEVWSAEIRNLDRQHVLVTFGGPTVDDVAEQAGRKLREFARDVAELVPRVLKVAGALGE